MRFNSIIFCVTLLILLTSPLYVSSNKIHVSVELDLDTGSGYGSGHVDKDIDIPSGSGTDTHTGNIDSNESDYLSCATCDQMGIALPSSPLFHTIKSYGVNSIEPQYVVHKALTVKYMNDLGFSDPMKKLCFAVGELETKFNPKHTDKKKLGSSANFSIFNINADLVQYLVFARDPKYSSEGWPEGAPFANNPALLDGLDGIKNALIVIHKAVETWGYPTFLNFLRGGRSGFTDGVSYGVVGYRNVIATIIAELDRKPQLFTNNQRVDIKEYYT